PPVSYSHRRRDAIPADRDRGGIERAVVLLVCGADEDLGSRLELALVAGNVGDYHRLGYDHDLLLSLLVLEGDLVPVHTFDRLRYGGVGHGAVGQVTCAMS